MGLCEIVCLASLLQYLAEVYGGMVKGKLSATG